MRLLRDWLHRRRAMPAMAANPADGHPPCLIEHLYDIGDWTEGSDSPGYLYNYLDYTFRDGERLLRARHYLDEPETILLLASEALQRQDRFAMEVLVHLHLRYGRIEQVSATGRQPLDPGLRDWLAQQVEARRRQL